jgi:hypothetical protein
MRIEHWESGILKAAKAAVRGGVSAVLRVSGGPGSVIVASGWGMGWWKPSSSSLEVRDVTRRRSCRIARKIGGRRHCIAKYRLIW